jgi:hypothetical protein
MNRDGELQQAEQEQRFIDAQQPTTAMGYQGETATQQPLPVATLTVKENDNMQEADEAIANSPEGNTVPTEANVATQYSKENSSRDDNIKRDSATGERIHDACTVEATTADPLVTKPEETTEDSSKPPMIAKDSSIRSIQSANGAITKRQVILHGKHDSLASLDIFAINNLKKVLCVAFHHR